MKSFLICVLAIVNIAVVALLIEERHKPVIDNDRNIVALTVNRIFHGQIDGTWPESYGSTMEQAKQFELEIIAAQKQGCTDWTQYKP